MVRGRAKTRFDDDPVFLCGFEGIDVEFVVAILTRSVVGEGVDVLILCERGLDFIGRACFLRRESFVSTLFSNSRQRYFEFDRLTEQS